MTRLFRKFFKERVYSITLFQLPIRCFYSILVRFELAILRAFDLFRRQPASELNHDNVTAVIKSFERPQKLQRLLKSIRRTHPKLNIIVVDDSKVPLELDGVHLIHLPFDSGVSAGRDAGLAEVKTKYMVNLDDDFIFTRKTKLSRAIDYLEQNPEVDLVAGEVTYLPYFKRLDYFNHQLMDYSQTPLFEKGTMIDDLRVYEKCANFFIANTEKLKTVGWDKSLKRLDHADFYTRARGKLTAVFDPQIDLLHDQTHFDENYLSMRHEYSQDSYVLSKRYPNSSHS